MMRYLATDVPQSLGGESERLEQLLAGLLGGDPEQYLDCRLERRSLDARHKAAIRFLVSISFETDQDIQGAALPPGVRLSPAPDPVDFSAVAVANPPKVVVVGTGPAGSFCALRLLDYGIEPILLERGPAMDDRVRKVEEMWSGGRLDPDANPQFGEGGAGTFSDGKLTTRISHPAIRYVLDAFVRFGASPDILYSAKPHIGTDLIRKCMVALRQHAESRGAVYRFSSKLVDLRIGRDGEVRAAVLASGEEIECDAVVLAMGHSARDTFEMLHGHGVAMNQKGFAMGVRIEHPQELIDRAQYGKWQGHPSLGAADYKLACNFGPSRAAYSFCMCPGGQVIQCASEEGGVVVNGMSNAKRDSGYANSGLVAKVDVSDFGSDHALAGMRFQRFWEQAAFRAAGNAYGAPAQSTPDFMKGRASGLLPPSTFRPQAVPTDLSLCLPPVVTTQLRDALPVFARKISGFTSIESLLLGIESRTSSPVRIERGEDGQSVAVPGLYPCGEGAGFAGGITSAAVDGIRVADWIARMSALSSSVRCV